MSSHRFATTLVALGTLSAIVIPAIGAHAVTTVYTDQASYLAALGAAPRYTEAFAGTTGNGTTSIAFTGSGYSYDFTSTNAATGVAGAVYRNGSFIGAQTDTRTLIITSSSGNFNAIGGNFFLTDIADATVAGSVTLNLGDGTTQTFTVGTTGTEFRGFISTTPITTLTMAPSVATTYNTVDNLTVANVAAAAVPEPGTFALLSAGLLPLVGVVARRRRNKNA